MVVTQNYPAHDEAARKLLLHLPERKHDQFLKGWKKYTEIYEEKKALGLSALIATEVDDLSLADVSTNEGMKYIYQQTAMRRQHIIEAVNNAISVL
ncbi:hypothetical protein [Motiliproteus sp. MSK22-1]|uniref:hypothetical protein n=1 Tax=Motiliproteus sp. MSK22-1 TaxID=1897630 RepID=UPI000975E8DB|nr:hypothetical protein [Motiliproteus sp. MSK22-1]OMH37982.1 hypothetical protein BGP75_06755 [Motiliproteus sp. MSK22-1]